MTRNGEEPPLHGGVEPVTPAADIGRRDAVRMIAALPLAALWTLSSAELERVRTFVDAAVKAGPAFSPAFFTPAEFRAVRLLADMIIPRDERSGSAGDAGVPEFMDFMMIDQPANQQWMRSGLAWLDRESKSRFSTFFADAKVVERNTILDDIAWPRRAAPSRIDGVKFFNSFRDLTASGFWSSRIGVKDLQYIGNKFVADWNGCPPAALRKLGVTYAKFDPRNLRLTPARGDKTMKGKPQT